MWGAPGAPHAPQRSSRPGAAGACLDPQQCVCASARRRLCGRHDAMIAAGRILAGVGLVVLLTAPAPVSAQLWRTPLPQGLTEPRRAPVTFTPSILVGEEYNDNIFLD